MQPGPAASVIAVIVGIAWTPPAGAQSAVPLKPLPAIQLEAVKGLPQLDGPRFSLSFSEPTSITDVLMLLVRDTRFSVIPSPGLDGRFIGDLKNVTLRQALDLILEPMALDYSVRGPVIRVFPRELETRIYNVDHVITQRTGRRSTGGTTDVVSTDAPDVFADLTTGVRALLSDEGRVGLDRTAGLLQVTDRAGRLARVEQYLETAMLRAERQVQIDARVVDVQLTSDAPAIDWRRVSREVSGADTAGSRAGTTMIVTASDPGVLLTALRAQGRVDVLASPTVTAMNNEPALVRVTTHEGQTVTGDVTLSVTPQISVDGIIEMSLSASVTSRVDSTVAVREADTVVRLRQGETAMIAGLLRDRPAAPVPGGGPDTARRTDTVILITPTMVQSRAATVPAGAR